jgi:hypothetical protein
MDSENGDEYNLWFISIWFFQSGPELAIKIGGCEKSGSSTRRPGLKRAESAASRRWWGISQINRVSLSSISRHSRINSARSLIPIHSLLKMNRQISIPHYWQYYAHETKRTVRIIIQLYSTEIINNNTLHAITIYNQTITTIKFYDCGGKMDLLLSLCYIALNFVKFIPFHDRMAAIKNI